jgi:hypothetical protein
LWFALLLVLVVGAGFSVHYLLLRKSNVKPIQATEKIKSPEPAAERKNPQKGKNEGSNRK